MRYELFYCSKKPFWTKNSVDKPSYIYFKNEYVDQEDLWKSLGNLTPNWINSFNATITLANEREYKYFKLVDREGQDKYFLIDSINKILNKGVVVNLTLDIWTSIFFNLLGDGTATYGVKVLINRLNKPHDYNINKLHISSQNDELLNMQFPITYLKCNKFFAPNLEINNKNAEYAGSNQYRFNYYESENADRWDWRSGGDWGRINEMVNIAGDQKCLNCPVFDVYQDINGDFYYFPIFTLDNLPDRSILWVVEGNGKNYNCTNTIYWVEKLKERKYWTNKYVGRYHIPTWTKLLRHVNYCVVEINQTKFIFGFYHRCGIIHVDYEDNTKNYYLPNEEITEELTYAGGEGNGQEEKNQKLPTCAFHLFKNLNNTSIGFYVVKNDSQGKRYVWFMPWHLYYSKWSFSFTPLKGFEITAHNPMGQFSNLQGFETMPTNTNGYNNYIAGVMNQQNTGLQIAKQQSIYKGIMGGLNNLADIYGATGNVKLDDPSSVVKATTQGFKGLLGIVGNIAGNILQYQNQEKQKRAFEADLMNKSTAHNFVSSNAESNLLNSFILSNTKKSGLYSIYDFDLIICRGPTIANSWQLNNLSTLIYKYGFAYNSIYTFSLYEFVKTNGQDFVYYDFEIDLDTIKKLYNSEYWQEEHLNACHLILNQPFRYWEVTPSFYTRHKLSYGN